MAPYVPAALFNGDAWFYSKSDPKRKKSGLDHYCCKSRLLGDIWIYSTNDPKMAKYGSLALIGYILL